MNAITFNAEDWTGEEITVEYNDNLEFELSGHKWMLDVKHHDRDGSASAKLIGDEWAKPLHTIFFVGHYGEGLEYLDDAWSPEEAIRRAAIYIRNCV